jgi:predicted nucleic acid-binding protein
MGKFQTLVDSDGWIAIFLPDDLLHDQAVSIYKRLEHQKKKLVTTSVVIAEVATVLSHRSGQRLAGEFLAAVERSQMPVIHIDEKLYRSALELFQRQEKKGTSFADCANVVVLEYFEIPSVFSFDRFYFNKSKSKQHEASENQYRKSPELPRGAGVGPFWRCRNDYSARQPYRAR